jgi:hypothetical protein
MLRVVNWTTCDPKRPAQSSVFQNDVREIIVTQTVRTSEATIVTVLRETSPDVEAQICRPSG